LRKLTLNLFLYLEESWLFLEEINQHKSQLFTYLSFLLYRSDTVPLQWGDFPELCHLFSFPVGWDFRILFKAASTWFLPLWKPFLTQHHNCHRIYRLGSLYCVAGTFEKTLKNLSWAKF
jgi:hypothetical protein